jgi:hypothetical protein
VPVQASSFSKRNQAARTPTPPIEEFTWRLAAQDTGIKNLDFIGGSCGSVSRDSLEFAEATLQSADSLHMKPVNAPAHGYSNTDIPRVRTMIRADLPPPKAQVLALIGSSARKALPCPRNGNYKAE